MATKRIRIASDLELPLDVVTQAIAILARRGAGKTYTAGVLVEQVVAARLPVVVLDPTGAWWGLRTSDDGTKPGLPVVIFGGEHGDVPLEQTAGKEIADVVVEHPGAYVIDLSGFESRRAEQRFAADFLERLYRAKAAAKDALLVVVDEADLFAPQRPGDEQARTLGALEAIVRRGRIRGLGVLLITQRAAVLNKNVLTQVEVLVAMQTTGPQDRAAIDDWIKGNGTAEERELVLGSLASLERGEAWIWSPSWLRTLKRIRIRAKTTYDSSRTPEAGEQLAAPRAFAPVDLEQLGARIQAAVEKAKADDPAELHRRIRELERRESNALQQLAKAELAMQDREPEIREVRVEVPVLDGQVDELRAAVAAIGEHAAPLQRFAGVIADAVRRLDVVSTTIEDVVHAATAAPRPAPHAIPTVTPGTVEAVRREGNAPSTSGNLARPTEAPLERGIPRLTGLGDPRHDGGASLGRAERSILGALATYPEPLTREQLAFLSGYHPRSKGFVNALGALRSAELLSPGFARLVKER